MNKYNNVILQAITAGMKGDIEALWVAKLLLTAEMALSEHNEPSAPKILN
jgi:hypothetical protein